jgi:hypothetical protein
MSQAPSASGAAIASAAATPMGDGKPFHLLALGICIETSFENQPASRGVVPTLRRCAIVSRRCRRYAAL